MPDEFSDKDFARSLDVMAGRLGIRTAVTNEEPFGRRVTSVNKVHFLEFFGLNLNYTMNKCINA